MKSRTLFTAVLIGWGISSVVWSQPVPSGPEFQVNTYTTFTQQYQSVAADPSGNFVVVWHSNGQHVNFNIFGQRFDNTGTPQGTEFQINTYTTGTAVLGEVATDPSGNFVVVWMSGQDGSNFGIFGQRFDNTGTPLGTEFQINTYTTSAQSVPSVAADASGNFVVVWQSYRTDGSGLGVFGQRLDNAGTPLGTEFQINTYTTSGQTDPSVAADASGNFVVVWGSNGQDGSSYGVFGQRFLPCSSPLGQVSGLQVDTANAGADLVLTWTDTPAASDYVVFEDDSPDGGFPTEVGTTTSGPTGLTIPMPPGTKFYLAAARNTACGLGPKHQPSQRELSR